MAFKIGEAFVEVLAETAKAEAQIRQLDSAARPIDIMVNALVNRAQSDIKSLQSVARPIDVQVDADTGGAESEIKSLGKVGGSEGKAIGGNITDGIGDAMGKLASRSGPIVGSVIGAVGTLVSLSPGILIGKAILDGMAGETSRAMFSARTGLDAATAKKFGAAAGEAYAANFGSSIAGNMDAAKEALHTGLLDPNATRKQIQSVVEQLTTVTDILGTDVPSVARAAGQAIKTGLAKNSEEAFDLITKAYQNGLDVSGDLLDTITEYGTQFRKLGLDGPTALGLVGQAVRAGARDTDVAADALKEFAIRASDGSKTTVAAFEAAGLSAEGMQQKFLKGGPEARAAFEETAKAIAAIEDPVKRNQATLDLFGTQFEDLGDALNAFDVTSAAQQFGNLEGTVKTAMAAIGGTTAAQLETAKRSIELAKNDIQEALATAFAPQIQDAAKWISQNREAVVRFFIEGTNRAFDMAKAVAQMSATGLRSLGEFARTGTSLIFTFVEGVIRALDSVPGIDMSRSVKELEKARGSAEQNMEAVDKALNRSADGIEKNVIPTIDSMQERFNEVAIPAQARAAFADATAKLSSQLEGVGLDANGAKLQISMLGDKLNTTTAAGKQFDGQLKSASAALQNQITTGQKAGLTQEELTATWNEGRGALVNQAMQMGLTRQQAEALVSRYASVPKFVNTSFGQPGMPGSQQAALTLTSYVNGIPNTKTTMINTNAWDAANQVARISQEVRNLPSGRTVTITTRYVTSGNNPYARGQVGLATGGQVHGPGTATSDSIPARLSNGEYVVKAAAVSKYGVKFMNAVNSMQFAGGGLVKRAPVVPLGGVAAAVRAPASAPAPAQRLSTATVTRPSLSIGTVHVSIDARTVQEIKDVREFFVTLESEVRRGRTNF